jgi:hypothetical protein
MLRAMTESMPPEPEPVEPMPVKSAAVEPVTSEPPFIFENPAPGEPIRQIRLVSVTGL